MAHRHTYVFRRQITNASAGFPLLQIQAPATASIEIIRAWLGQSSSETSLQTAIRLARKSAGAAVTAAVIATDIFPLDAFDPATSVIVGAAATGHTGTGTGTTSAILIEEAYNVVGSGWLYLPVPEERIIVPASGIIALEPVEALTATLHCGIVYNQL